MTALADLPIITWAVILAIVILAAICAWAMTPGYRKADEP